MDSAVWTDGVGTLETLFAFVSAVLEKKCTMVTFVPSRPLVHGRATEMIDETEGTT